jgi:hypothetical protein
MAQYRKYITQTLPEFDVFEGMDSRSNAIANFKGYPQFF